MGYYINPINGTDKEDFLIKHGKQISKQTFVDFEFSGQESIHLPIALVDNGLFTAAAIAYNSNERDCFADDNDQRPVTYWLVPTNCLDHSAGLMVDIKKII